MTSNLRDRKNQAQDEQISVPYADNIGFKQNVNVWVQLWIHAA